VNRTLVGICEEKGWFLLIEGSSLKKLRETFKNITFDRTDLEKLEQLTRPMLKISKNPSPFRRFLKECRRKIARQQI